MIKRSLYLAFWMLVIYPQSTSAQAHYTLCSTDSMELLIWLDDTAGEVTLTMDNRNTAPSPDSTWVFSTSEYSWTSYDDCPWGANLDPSPYLLDDKLNLPPNVLLEFSVEPTGGEARSFLYMYCVEDGPDWSDADSFYCPQRHGSRRNDMWIVVVGIDVHYAGDTWYLNGTTFFDTFSGYDEDFLWPLDIEAYCEAQSAGDQAACEASTKRSGYFWTEQVEGPPFSHMNDDLVVLPGHEIMIESDEVLSMQSGTGIEVHGQLDVDGMTFQGEVGGTWAGMEFGSTFEDSSLEDVTIDDVYLGWGDTP